MQELSMIICCTARETSDQTSEDIEKESEPRTKEEASQEMPEMGPPGQLEDLPAPSAWDRLSMAHLQRRSASQRKVLILGTLMVIFGWLGFFIPAFLGDTSNEAMYSPLGPIIPMLSRPHVLLPQL